VTSRHPFPTCRSRGRNCEGGLADWTRSILADRASNHGSYPQAMTARIRGVTMRGQQLVELIAALNTMRSGKSPPMHPGRGTVDGGDRNAGSDATLTIHHRWAAPHCRRGSGTAQSTAEKYSSRNDPQRALPTESDHLTAAKTFNDLPAASSQRGDRRLVIEAQVVGMTRCAEDRPAC
jgi:hypothetical protein